MRLILENTDDIIKIRTFGLNILLSSLLLKSSNQTTGEIKKFTLQFDSQADIDSLISDLDVLKKSMQK